MSTCTSVDALRCAFYALAQAPITAAIATGSDEDTSQHQQQLLLVCAAPCDMPLLFLIGTTQHVHTLVCPFGPECNRCGLHHNGLLVPGEIVCLCVCARVHVSHLTTHQVPALDEFFRKLRTRSLCGPNG